MTFFELMNMFSSVGYRNYVKTMVPYDEGG